MGDMRDILVHGINLLLWLALGAAIVSMIRKIMGLIKRKAG